jgi:hypothetical protein
MAKRTTPERAQLSWAQAYESRMRRFNLTVILAALSALAILIPTTLVLGTWSPMASRSVATPYKQVVMTSRAESIVRLGKYMPKAHLFRHQSVRSTLPSSSDPEIME